MTADAVVDWALGFVVVWFVAVALHALIMARRRECDPLPPDPPEHQH